MTITLVLARADNGVIGRNGGLPWRLPADLRRFKALTLGKPMIMGRRTFESFPAALPGRRHIVLTRDGGWRADGAEVAHTPEAALALAGRDASVVGGAEIAALLLPWIERAELTEVHAAPEGDTVVPPLVGWREVAREKHEAAGDAPAYSFVTLERDPASRSGRGMERLDGSAPAPAHLRGGVVALGNFDGFHLGHQAVVGRAVARARAEGRPALVATFDPHPVRFFRPDTPPFRLTTLEQRERLFEAAGVDATVVLHFDAALAGLSAEAFVRERLVDLLGVAGVVTGEDFTFGKGKSGDVATLRAFGAELGFTAETVGAVTLDGETVSSTRIREALRRGDPRTAARLLTRPFAVQGVVQHGDKLGRTIGYPTANLAMGKYLRPAYGIYAVEGRLGNGRVLQGAANLGVRPTFDPPKELLEPYFFDFAGDLYGETIEVALIEYLRPEAKFDGVEALKAQMVVDCERARAMLR